MNLKEFKFISDNHIRYNIGSTKYCIEREELDILAIDHMYNPRVMYFETNEIRNIFLEDQKDLLKIVKPLL